VALPAISLSADAVTLTAWANDAGFDQVFARQVAAFGQPGDVLVAISTSGRSRNIVLALQEARRRGLRTVALVGMSGGDARLHADTVLAVPSDDTQHIQEVHLTILHLLADLVDRAWHQRDEDRTSPAAMVVSAPSAASAAVPIGVPAESPVEEHRDEQTVRVLTSNGYVGGGR
jgi:fructoselysine-6-P-deglycase FrlB-like protein